jgi:hypothetical protein
MKMLTPYRLAMFLTFFGTSACAFAGGSGQSVSAVQASAAADHATSGVSVSAEQRVREELQLMLARLAASGAFGQHPEQIALSLDEPAQRVTNLGLLVDSSSAANTRDGLHVLGTTPGGSADHMGVRSGDVVLAVNGISLRELGVDSGGRALAAQLLKSTVDAIAEDAPFELEVRRNDATIKLSAPLQAVRLPALRMQLGEAVMIAANDSATVRDMTASAAAAAPAASSANDTCGRISSFDVAPRSKHLYRARIDQIDGKNAGPTRQETFRVSAGVHRVLVTESIPTLQMGVGEMATLRRKTTKEFSVTVNPGSTALVAAQFNQDKATDWANGGYWDPVVWKEIAESCP